MVSFRGCSNPRDKPQNNTVDRDENGRLYYTYYRGSDEAIKNKDFKKVLVIGNEGLGISSGVKKNSDVVVGIPMRGKINSLNASVSAGILIYRMDD